MNKVTRTTAMAQVKADSISRMETAARASRYSIKLEPSDSGTAAAAINYGETQHEAYTQAGVRRAEARNRTDQPEQDPAARKHRSGLKRPARPVCPSPQEVSRR
jgi:hypothetical protein